MEEAHRHIADRLAVVRQFQAAFVSELADGGGFDTLGRAQTKKLVPLVGWDGEDHPFLGFADPDLGVGETGVFQRALLQPDDCTDVFAHLAHGRTEASRAAVGDRVVEALVAGLQHHVHHHLLGDGVADLDGSARDRFTFVSQLGGRERRAVNAVASRAASHRDDEVAGMDLLLDLADRDHRGRAAIDQRVTEVSLVEEHRPVDGRDAHAVAVVAHARDDALHHGLRVQSPRRQRIERRVGRSETEDVRVENRPGPETRAEWIADHAAEARVGTAIRFDGRRMVVRFDLEADMLLVVELHDARIVLEDADAPIVLAEPLANLDRRAEDGLFEHVLEDPLTVFVAVADAALQRLVRAVFAPRLSDRFEFDVGWIALLLDPVLLDGLHLGEAQIELAVLAEVHQRVVVHRPDGDGSQLELVLAPGSDGVHVERPGDDSLDGVVCENSLRHTIQIGGRSGGIEPILPPGRDRFDIEAEIDERLVRAERHVVGDARLEEDVEESSAE